MMSYSILIFMFLALIFRIKFYSNFFIDNVSTINLKSSSRILIDNNIFMFILFSSIFFITTKSYSLIVFVFHVALLITFLKIEKTKHKSLHDKSQEGSATNEGILK
jgi:hypothetical protein